MATHSSILVWRIPWTEKPVGLYSPQGRKGSNTTEVTLYTHTEHKIIQTCPSHPPESSNCHPIVDDGFLGVGITLQTRLSLRNKAAE